MTGITASQFNQPEARQAFTQTVAAWASTTAGSDTSPADVRVLLAGRRSLGVSFQIRLAEAAAAGLANQLVAWLKEPASSGFASQFSAAAARLGLSLPELQVLAASAFAGYTDDSSSSMSTAWKFGLSFIVITLAILLFLLICYIVQKCCRERVDNPDRYDDDDDMAMDMNDLRGKGAVKGSVTNPLSPKSGKGVGVATSPKSTKSTRSKKQKKDKKTSV